MIIGVKVLVLFVVSVYVSTMAELGSWSKGSNFFEFLNFLG
jgi:hypothetical protein